MSTPTDIITRCPKCATAFKATAQVLKIAKGTVRCGSCLSVFNAATHDINKPEVIPAPQQTPPPEPVTKAPASPTTTQQTTPIAQDDESWALDLLADEEEEEDIDLDDESLDIDHDKVEPTISDLTPHKTTSYSTDDSHDNRSQNDGDDALFINIINNDLQNEHDSHEPVEDVISSSLLDDDPLEQIAQASNKSEAPDHKASDTEQHNQFHISLDDITLHDDPEIQAKRWPWFIGALCMSLLLMGQIAWQRFDTLGSREPYRQYYQYACQIFQCTLPLLSDQQQIRTSHLVIRSHPTEKGALIADAIIINEAPFEQAFPALQLEFRDINNTLIASRDFQPHEYLKGNLLDATIMPAKQAVQLSLSVLDPGKNAVNYRINTTQAKARN